MPQLKTTVSRHGILPNVVNWQLTKLIIDCNIEKQWQTNTQWKHLSFPPDTSPHPTSGPQTPCLKLRSVPPVGQSVQKAGVSPLSVFSLCCYLFLTQLLQHGLLHRPQDLWSHTSLWVSSVSYQRLFAPGLFWVALCSSPCSDGYLCFSTALASHLVHLFRPALFCPLSTPTSLSFFSIPPAWHLSPASPSGYHPFLITVPQRCHKLPSCLLPSGFDHHRVRPDLLPHGSSPQPRCYWNLGSHGQCREPRAAKNIRTIKSRSFQWWPASQDTVIHAWICPYTHCFLLVVLAFFLFFFFNFLDIKTH